jgi:hypothetical protein
MYEPLNIAIQGSPLEFTTSILYLHANETRVKMFA